jgi:hypothetical protein
MNANSFIGKAGTSNTETDVMQVVRFATRYTRIACFIATARASGGISVFRLDVNGVASSPLLTCTIPQGSNTGTGSVPPPGVTVIPGDRLTIDVLTLPGSAVAGTFALAP